LPPVCEARGAASARGVRSPGKKLVERRAERGDVHPTVDPRRLLELLRGHVPRRANERCGARRRSHVLAAERVFRELRGAEIEALQQRWPRRPIREEEISWLDVAMDHAEAMGFEDPFASLNDVVDRVGDLDPLAL